MFVLLGAILCSFCPALAQSSCPRGAAVLALQNPRFPVQQAIDTLSYAAPSTSFAFVDYAFGRSFNNVRALTDGLLNHPIRPSSHVTVVAYLECGPCRSPRRPAGLFPLLAPWLNIPGLNRGLNRATQTRIVGIFVKEAERMAVSLPVRPGVSYVIEPALESNFTRDAELVVTAILRDAFRGRPDIAIGHNSVVGVVLPGPRETHSFSVNLNSLQRGDILTGDGVPNDPSPVYMRAACARGVNILLWRPEWQGLSRRFNGYVSPSRRQYRWTDAARIKQLLRR